MSKILLIKPRFLDLKPRIITQPMGLMYIGAMLKKASHELKIHDCALDYKQLQILRRTIKDWQPDFIGISIIITEVEQTKKIMSIIREIRSDVPVTFGGPWPSANPDESIKTLGADYVVIGEGEFVFPELIEALNHGRPTESIPGTVSLVNGNVKINPGRHLTEEELDNLPFPAWDLLDHKLYAKMHSMPAVGCRRYMAIVTSRGCPYKCAYCHQTMGKVFRQRSVRSVVAEMEDLRFKFGFREMEIIDDCFNLDRKRMYEILTGIRDRIGDARLHFPNGLRADLIEPRDMDVFKQAGTVSVIFAVETASPRLQKMIRKNLNLEKTLHAIKASTRAGIYSSGFFMIGFPTESYKEASDTVEFAVRSTLHRPMFLHVVPYAGTELAEMTTHRLKNEKSASDPQEMTFHASTVNISAMSDRELQRVFRHAHMRVYLNPKIMLRLALHHPQILALPYYAFLMVLRILPGMRHQKRMEN
jgi:anaerobic magnesium-protoporphyrin IX monomethyl ester cyclase